VAKAVGVQVPSPAPNGKIRANIYLDKCGDWCELEIVI